MDISEKIKVCIPVYKETLTYYEQIALEQGRKIFGDRNIIFFAPMGLHTEYIAHGIQVVYFKEKYFFSRDGYNELMLSKAFYDTFEEYEYILIYQLDGFVFSDQLDHFVSLGYDYIGAPWMLPTAHANLLKYDFSGAIRLRKWFPFLIKLTRLYVGNGGVSLRKVRSFQNLLAKYEAKADDVEDLFFSAIGYKHPDILKVAPIEVALNFSFEQEPRECFVQNGEKLPFCCHAWERYDIDFWREIFLQYGYKI